MVIIPLTASMNLVFYFLYSDALTPGALLTLEGPPLLEIVNN